MRQSKMFTRTERNVPKDEAALNAQLLVRAGFVHKVMAGVYEYLPLGYRVLQNINRIIREEMDATGAEELHMSILQSKETWSKTKRWDTGKEVMYQFEDAAGKAVGLGWTHEEPLSVVAKHYISSYKDLPKAVYQIQTKFRNEPRAKSGVLRGREFLMKDLYSFHTDEADLDTYYERVAEAYGNVFRRVGVPARRTLASGGLFSKLSDEFQALSEVGEDTIRYCTACEYAANQEVADELKLKDSCPDCSGKLTTGQAIEVGNIFKLGTKFSEAFELVYTDEAGTKKSVVMASYGIGPSRLMGTAVELSHDERGIIWPESVAPYRVHLVELSGASAKDVYAELQKAGVEVLYDDRDVSAGEKFADADLIGIPWRAVVSPKLERKIEVKRRHEKDGKTMTLDEFVQSLR